MSTQACWPISEKAGTCATVRPPTCSNAVYATTPCPHKPNLDREKGTCIAGSCCKAAMASMTKLQIRRSPSDGSEGPCAADAHTIRQAPQLLVLHRASHLETITSRAVCPLSTERKGRSATDALHLGHPCTNKQPALSLLLHASQQGQQFTTSHARHCASLRVHTRRTQQAYPASTSPRSIAAHPASTLPPAHRRQAYPASTSAAALAYKATSWAQSNYGQAGSSGIERAAAAASCAVRLHQTRWGPQRAMG
jgi:hypothetical protein